MARPAIVWIKQSDPSRRKASTLVIVVVASLQHARLEYRLEFIAAAYGATDNTLHVFRMLRRPPSLAPELARTLLARQYQNGIRLQSLMRLTEVELRVCGCVVEPAGRVLMEVELRVRRCVMLPAVSLREWLRLVLLERQRSVGLLRRSRDTSRSAAYAR